MALVLWPGLLVAGLLTAVLFRVHVDHSDVKESTGSCNWKIRGESLWYNSSYQKYTCSGPGGPSHCQVRAMSDLVSFLSSWENYPNNSEGSRRPLNSLNLSGHKSKQLEKQLKVVQSS